MPLKPVEAVERYRTLGLAIEAAVVLDNWNEVETLIDQRDGILTQFALGGMILTPLAKQQMKACDHRLLQFLMHAKSHTASEIRKHQCEGNARTTYSMASASSGLDCAS